jgi:hypothetical protein
MANITLSPSFFLNELKSAYSDWRFAFWRELLQNSYDAKSSTVTITLKEKDGFCVVSCLDDGPGMDLNTLENVYFVVGETTKTGPDSIGGFGRARILTCFGHVQWKIATNEWVCSGSGCQYEIARAADRQEGCLVEVTVSLAGLEDMRSALDLYLKSCQLSCEVRVNGELFKDWAYRNRRAGKLSFGTVFLNKSKARHSVLVRVNGVHMFARYTQAAWQVVIEIEQGCSRKVLTSNRDGLTGEASRELDDFIGSIWTSPLSAVRRRHQSFREDRGAPVYSVQRKGAEDEEVRDDEERLEFAQEAVPRVGGYTALCDSSIQLRSPYVDAGALEKKRAPVRFVFSLECDSRPLQVAAERFRPETIGGTRLKLLEKWTDACHTAAEEFVELERDCLEFRTGFTFVEDELASCRTNGTGVGDLLLRPVRSNGTLAYSVSSKADMARLLALAAHEVTHLIYPTHDERFVRAFTMLLGRLLGRSKKIKGNPGKHYLTREVAGC